MQLFRQLVPHLFTLANLFAGFYGLVMVARGEFLAGFGFIVLAALFDMLDGILSRWIGVASEFGVELDSLADLVSFGVAPAYLLYAVHFHQLGEPGILLSAIPALAGALRLARFNVQLTSLADKSSYTGLPIPAAALTLGSYAVFYHPLPLASPWESLAPIGLTVLLAGMMLSRVQYPNVPRYTRRYIRQHPVETIVFSLGVLVVVVTMGKALFPLLLVYVVGAIPRHLLRHRAERARRRIEELDTEGLL
jgi:CDP-diacylglycerol--serine O-phosphatidyltransferase